MPRPIKPRKIGYIPQNKMFVPYGKKIEFNDYIILLHDELEAIRLKDIENLHQNECAEIMDVSRQTFQLIIDSARKKVARALIEGNPIKIEGGHYTLSKYTQKCPECGKIHKTESFSNHKRRCCGNCQNNKKTH
ncbi:DUF134 domain-containing protein [Mycoplasmatota bacterium]|nr:DUF134 domain-containing protein [Mycoplasmatota bacterium]